MPSAIPNIEVITAKEADALLPDKSKQSKYAGILDAMANLKADKSIRVPFAASHDVKKVIRNLSMAQVLRKIKAPAGYGFFKSVGTDNSLIVTLRARKVGGKRNRKAKGK